MTWGHLLVNLGIRRRRQLLVTDDGRILADGAGKTLKLVLNGRVQSSVHNSLIASDDRLLVSYGAESREEVLQRQFPTVAADAPEFNPAGCAGAAEPTMWDRDRHAAVG